MHNLVMGGGNLPNIDAMPNLSYHSLFSIQSPKLPRCPDSNFFCIPPSLPLQGSTLESKFQIFDQNNKELLCIQIPLV